ncbi:unnamed protein product, partial [Rotaria sp. Silwood1]
QRPLAQFKIKVKAHWNKQNEQVQVFDLHDEDDEQYDDDDDDQQAEENDEEMIEQDDEN